jgi:hypothetical protein
VSEHQLGLTPSRYLVADLWLNPEDNGQYAYVALYRTNDEAEADRAVETADARYDHSPAHRTWAIDLLDPEQVKDISVLFEECAETEEDLA